MCVSAQGFRVRKDRKAFPALARFPSASLSPSTSGRAHVQPSLRSSSLIIRTSKAVAPAQQTCGALPERYVIAALRAPVALRLKAP